jgi:DNA-binding winged helix-turn-helix (wHTH) protein
MKQDFLHLESRYPDNSRFAEIEQILKFVKEGNSCQMIAMPGVGRGNVCKFLAYNHHIRVKHLGDDQKKYHFVFINFAEVKKRPLADVLKFIFLELVTSLHDRKLPEAFKVTDAMFKDSLKYKDELVLFEGLKKAIDYLVYDQKLYVILLFERFETYLPQLTEEFFIDLRSLRDRAKYMFSVLFSVTRPLEDIIEPSIMADFSEFFVGKHVYLTLCDEPGILFRIHYLEELTKKKLPEKTIQELMRLTAGHGKLTRLGTEALLGTGNVILNSFQDLSKKMPKQVRHDSLDSFLLSQKSIQNALQELWEFLTPEEQSFVILATESRLNRDEGRPESLNVSDKRDSRLRGNDEITNDDNFLNNINLIKNNIITIPLFQNFIQTKMHSQTTEPETIVYDATTNTIKKGDSIISENLTALEFRLLCFLIEHAGTILDRETIIQAVWQENASTIGVTDQALDQLIFRLRKKIETNPNAPAFIETVKGRGIKFQNM